jgi:hypothetical protein
LGAQQWIQSRKITIPWSLSPEDLQPVLLRDEDGEMGEVHVRGRGAWIFGEGIAMTERKQAGGPDPGGGLAYLLVLEPDAN